MIGVFVGAMLLFAVAPPVSTSPRSLQVGVLHEGGLFLIEPGGHIQVFSGGLTASRFTLVRCLVGQPKTVVYWLPPEYLTRAVQWRIAHGCVWINIPFVGLSSNLWRIPLADLDVLDVTLPPEAYEKRFPAGLYGNYHHERLILPLADFTVRYNTRLDRSGLLAGRPIPGAYGDFLPSDEERVLYFLLHRGRLWMWRGDRPKLNRESLQSEYTWSRRPVAEWKTSLAEPFIAFAGTNRYWFLTVSGKLYAAATDGRKGAALAAVWVEPKRPVRAALTDTASGKTFLFGGEPGGGPGFCLELKADARPVPFPTAAKAGETPLRRLERYARELADRQFIRLNAARPAARKP